MDVPSVHDHQTHRTSDPSPPNNVPAADHPHQSSPTSTITSGLDNPPACPSTPEPAAPAQPDNHSSGAPPQALHDSSSSLDKEIEDFRKTLGDVGASLGGWWGKVQKQSVDALTTSGITAQLNNARKDLVSLNLLDKAKREFEKLGEQAKEGYTVVSSELHKGPSEIEMAQGRVVNVDGVELPAQPNPSTASVESTSPKGKEPVLHEAHSAPNPLLDHDKSGIISFFSKLSKDGEKLAATLQSTLSQLPTTVQAANPARLTNSGRFDLGEVQKLAEGYLAKGEVYLQDVGKELREIAQEAVRVIPPTEAQDDSTSRLHSLRSSAELVPPSVSQQRKMLDTKRVSSITKLRSDASLLLKNPEEDEKSSFEEFASLVTEGGGIPSEIWQKRIQQELQVDEADGTALKTTLNELVPGKISMETFWVRYFYLLHRIDQEEAARRKVLSAAHEENEGEFSWDLEDESETSSPAVFLSRNSEDPKSDGDSRAETPTMGKPEIPNAQHKGGQGPSASGGSSTSDKPDDSGKDSTPTQKPASASGRNSSDGTTDSFDVVSAQQSADESSRQKEGRASAASGDIAEKPEDEDSDWE